MSGHSGEPGTSALLQRLITEGTEPRLPLAALLGGMGSRAYGVFLIVACIPCIVPGLAAISGPLVMWAGAQMLFGLSQPWLPKRLAAKSFAREQLRHGLTVINRPLHALERLCKPRWFGLWQHGGWLFNGLLLLVLGVALALPIPLTNYVLAAPIVLIALALIERDGVLLLAAWGTSLIALAIVTITYGTLLHEAWQWLQSLR